MTTTRTRERSYALADPEAQAPFAHTVCGIDPTPESKEAARQAAVLAGRAGRVIFVSADRAAGGGRPTDDALGDAIAVAEDLGAEPAAAFADGAGPAYALLERAGDEDLVVVGSHGNSRARGIVFGSVATTLLHRSTSALLIARPALSARPFPRELLVASDASAASHEAIRLAAAIARRHHANVTHLHVGAPDETRRHVLRDERRLLEQAAGKPPVGLVETGPVHEAIAAAARERRSSLVVVGSRGLTGLRAVGSVSERVGHEAPCSVLVARPPKGRR